jgi:hypothetical protein
MKKYIISLLLIISQYMADAQPTLTKDILGFAITDYIVDAGDSIMIVQIELPDGDVKVEEKKLGMLLQAYKNGGTDTIGFGRCNLIKGNYYYFGIKLRNKNLKPKAGDMVYVQASFDIRYKGLFYQLMRHQVFFKDVRGGAITTSATGLIQNLSSEDELLNTIASDVRYTGEAMQQQQDGQDQLIKGGRFDGKKVFAAMNTVTKKDVTDFIKYIIARPRLYAGNTWAVAEIFATWMVGGTPTVKE